MRRIGFGAVVLLVAGCDGVGAATAGLTESPAGVAIYVLASVDGMPAGEGTAADECNGPLSSRYTLAAGRWSSESRWYADCLDSTRPRSVIVQSYGGSYVQRGSEVVLHDGAGPASEAEEEELVHGTLRGDTLTLWGHCGGETQYARLGPASR